MMRWFLVLFVPGLASPCAPIAAQDKKEPVAKARPGPALEVGDLAPPLQATRWLQGVEVRKFEPGKIYVVSFWATWCGAPIRYMPHLADLQARYRDQGVTIISFTARDIRGVPDNSEEKVAAFVKKRGPSLRYPFAYADDRKMVDPWMKGQEHFSTFVVDRTGRIAYIGGPMFLGLALSRVVAGGASAKAVGAAMARVDADYRTVVATLNRDRRAGLRALAEFEARYPVLADFLPVVYAKLDHALKQETPGAGKDMAEKLVTRAIRQNNVVVLELAYGLLRDRKECKELQALAVRAAEALVRIDGGQDAWGFLRLADAYLLSGEKARAKQCARRAIEAAVGEPSRFRAEIKKEVRRLGLE